MLIHNFYLYVPVDKVNRHIFNVKKSSNCLKVRKLTTKYFQHVV